MHRYTYTDNFKFVCALLIQEKKRERELAGKKKCIFIQQGISWGSLISPLVRIKYFLWILSLELFAFDTKERNKKNHTGLFEQNKNSCAQAFGWKSFYSYMCIGVYWSSGRDVANLLRHFFDVQKFLSSFSLSFTFIPRRGEKDQCSCICFPTSGSSTWNLMHLKNISDKRDRYAIHNTKRWVLVHFGWAENRLSCCQFSKYTTVQITFCQKCAYNDVYCAWSSAPFWFSAYFNKRRTHPSVFDFVCIRNMFSAFYFWRIRRIPLSDRHSHTSTQTNTLA